MEKVVALTKRRGFIFPSSEIYGGVSGFYDYGPYGVAMKRAIRDLWWRHMVELRDDVVGLESTLIMPSSVWAASGHLTNFVDPLRQCLGTCKKRWRADHVQGDRCPCRRSHGRAVLASGASDHARQCSRARGHDPLRRA